ncbi:phosphoribosylanthranilate isomerase [Lachnoclostridium phytofermentans]|uniref:N-(5'-phosphoribosyl)anthranilate isomerase n=1 Tax=Lachnoclostridium phytofermentans (strain ATCC 700394 / DSM 18823 / ISDg) TaxID=357809 RepID=TRPF_LACP7|nr:phosphoribosylanthranilate isomerase [Lachnoclostridium phytofermentans]A9KL42.1 RecName: Full=N-(5'-phosphoribosyl)anthranilate isomerase; Short=PRAI [Lachnoclostridium phytofermentans ISDg]ABX44191.1 Phosphoribosylanthranilate isomerase [Lachnoclostridium phytofermentans ISDg]
MKTKICGLKSLREIEIVNKYAPNYVGFVFAGVKRKIDEEVASLLRRELSSEIQAVGVFVNESIERIAKMCEKNTIQLVQLHGDEDRDYINALKLEVGAPIIKAVRAQSVEQILEALTLPCDYFLYDTYSEHSYGGEGKRFDETILTEVYKESSNNEFKKYLQKPYFIAGGLTAQNVRLLDSRLEPYGVDVSSGVESMGQKDEEKVKEFLFAAWRWNEN